MASHTTTLTIQIFPFTQHPTNVVTHQHHVRGVAGLATGFHISTRKEWPEPVFIRAVGLLYAGGGPSISLVARRTAKLFRIVNLQQVGFGMSGKGQRVFVGFLALKRHCCWRKLNGFPDAHMARLAAIDDIGVRHIDLQYFRGPVLGLVLQARQLRRREVGDVVGDIGIDLFFLVVDRLDRFSEFHAQQRALVFQVIVDVFQLSVVVVLLAAIGKNDRSDFLFILLQIFLFALFCRGAGLRFDFVREGADIGSPVGKHVLHGKNFGAQVAEFFVEFLDVRGGTLAGRFVVLLEFLIVWAAFNVLLQITRLRARAFEESRVAALPLMLKGFPGTLSEVFIPESPE